MWLFALNDWIVWWVCRLVWLYVACLLSFVVGCFGLRFCCAGWFGGVFNDCVFWFGFIQVIVVLRWLVWLVLVGFVVCFGN